MQEIGKVRVNLTDRPLTMPEAWIIVRRMNGLNAICGICRDIIR